MERGEADALADFRWLGSATTTTTITNVLTAVGLWLWSLWETRSVSQPEAEGGGFPVGWGEGPVGNRALCGSPWEGPRFP